MFGLDVVPASCPKSYRRCVLCLLCAPASDRPAPQQAAALPDAELSVSLERHVALFDSSDDLVARQVRWAADGLARRSLFDYSATTLLRSVPIPVMSISHTSPGFMLRGEPSVPIHMTSPG